MKPSTRRLETPVMSVTIAGSAQSVRHTDRRRWFVVYEHDRSTVFFFLLPMVRSRRRFFCRQCQYFVFIAELVSISSKTNTHAKQDFYDSEQYCFFPHTPLQLNKSSSEGLSDFYCSFSLVSVYPSIHRQPLIRDGSSFSRGPRLSFPWPHQSALTGGSQGVPRPVQRYNISTWTWVCPGASSQLDVPGTPP